MTVEGRKKRKSACQQGTVATKGLCSAVPAPCNELPALLPLPDSPCAVVALPDSPCSASVVEAVHLDATCRAAVCAGRSREQRVILCFGDSLTAGFSRRGGRLTPYSDRLRQVMCERGLAEHAIPGLMTAGVRSETTSAMCKRLPDLLEKYEGLIDVGLILGGTNDLGDVPVQTVLGNLEQLHKMAHAAGARTGILTVPDCTFGATDANPRPYDKEQAEINAGLRGLVEQDPEHFFLVDVARALPQDGKHAEMWEGDGTHFSARGYEALGEMIADAIMRQFPEDVVRSGPMLQKPAA